MGSSVQDIEAIINYYSNDRDLLKQQYYQNQTQANNLIHGALIVLGIILSLVTVSNSLLLPYNLNNYNNFAQTANQNTGYLIQLIGQDNSTARDILINSSLNTINFSIYGMNVSQNVLTSIVKSSGALILVGFAGVLIFVGLSLHSLAKIRKKIIEDIDNVLNVIHCLHVLKIRYAEKLDSKMVKNTINLFFISTKDYLTKLRQLLDLLHDEQKQTQKN
ncbi:hypothetical protein C4580_04410 [Candidatus Woesearchaeota archaeon]|nr:MAG: hypothetical protein C4580_04410 [Candidatus Woesearchaeota archaeon]